jgi:uncharacterized protein YjdB
VFITSKTAYAFNNDAREQGIFNGTITQKQTYMVGDIPSKDDFIIEGTLDVNGKIYNSNELNIMPNQSKLTVANDNYPLWVRVSYKNDEEQGVSVQTKIIVKEFNSKLFYKYDNTEFNIDSIYVTSTDGLNEELYFNGKHRIVTNTYGKEIQGEFKTSNNLINPVKGSNTISYIFIPTDSRYDTLKGTFIVNYYPPEIPLPTLDKTESITTSTNVATALTVNSLYLDTGTSYDINLSNKVSGSSYEWTTSNSSIATVSRSGLVTAKRNGKSTIKCKVTSPDNKVQTLTAEVTVGTNIEDYPTLNETSLDLEVGDIFDINVEDKISDCKYKFTSSNKSLAKVTTLTGKVTALNKGDLIIICTITTKDKDMIVLKCNVNIE